MDRLERDTIRRMEASPDKFFVFLDADRFRKLRDEGIILRDEDGYIRAYRSAFDYYRLNVSRRDNMFVVVLAKYEMDLFGFFLVENVDIPKDQISDRQKSEDDFIEMRCLSDISNALSQLVEGFYVMVEEPVFNKDIIKEDEGYRIRRRDNEGI